MQTTYAQTLTEAEDRLQDVYVAISAVLDQVGAHIPQGQVEDLATVGRLAQLAHAKLQDFNTDRYQEAQAAQMARERTHEAIAAKLAGA